MSGGWRSRRRRSLASVSPVRTPTVGTCARGVPSSSAARWIPANGARRFFSTSTARARSGDTYRTRVRRSASGGRSAASRSIAPRNAASVLPEPVGASTSVFDPAAIGGHAPRCASVGASNDPSNQRRAAGEKVALSTDEPRYPLVRTSVCPTGLLDLGNGVQMERSAAHDAATPPKGALHAAVVLRVPPGRLHRRSPLAP